MAKGINKRDGKNWKTTSDMTKSELSALQSKLNDMLATAIEDVKALGYEVYEIQPKVRITNNKSRIGSANVANDAKLQKTGYACTSRRGRMLASKNLREEWTKTPVFRISLSTRECSCDEDIMDTLYHEVIHCLPGCFNHGKNFKSAAAKVNSAYGANVDTSKKENVSAGSTKKLPNNSDLCRALAAKIGETFQLRNRSLTFMGFNGRPKKCCDLIDSNGNMYVCDLRTCAFGFGLID